jgi:hypothetical protein
VPVPGASPGASAGAGPADLALARFDAFMLLASAEIALMWPAAEAAPPLLLPLAEAAPQPPALELARQLSRE